MAIRPGIRAETPSFGPGWDLIKGRQHAWDGLVMRCACKCTLYSRVFARKDK